MGCHERRTHNRQPEEIASSDPAVLRAALTREAAARRHAECMVQVQTGAVELALELLVREPDIEGFFGAFTKSLVEGCDAQSCGVWLIDEDQRRCDFWMAYLVDRLYTRNSANWESLKLPREAMSAHLFSYKAGWTTTVTYTGDDPRLPEPVRAYNQQAGVQSLAVSPLVLGDRNLGWILVGLRASVGGRRARSHRPSGNAGAPPEPAGRPAADRGAAQGNPRRAQSIGAGYSRQSGARLRRHPHATPSCAA
jgi:hypothetical protein